MPLRHLLVAGAVPVPVELERDARRRPFVHQLLRWDSIVSTVFGHVQTPANDGRDSGRGKDVGKQLVPVLFSTNLMIYAGSESMSMYLSFFFYCNVQVNSF